MLQEYCQLYFNIFALFFPHSINVTVWTMGYAILYHTNLLYRQYKVGYGIMSLQAKEAKHAGLKDEVKLTNRSTSCSTSGKWWQVMRSNYVRTFYLPEHQPTPSSYNSHYKSCVPPHYGMSTSCDCGRTKFAEEMSCLTCNESTVVTECARTERLTSEAVAILKPVFCEICNMRFADISRIKAHTCR